MKFAIYLPPQSEDTGVKLPTLYWLSGLTCNENNFIQKAGAQSYAAEHGLIIVCPDTSPRGVDIPGQDDSYDFGSGAGFYVDAITDQWNKHYKMFTYVTKELIEVINHNFPTVEGLQSIFGHSVSIFIILNEINRANHSLPFFLFEFYFFAAITELLVFFHRWEDTVP